MLHLLTARLVSLTCPQSISLVFIVPSKGKLGKEESKTSLVGMRCYGLIGILGVSCGLQRCRLKTLCWSQAQPAGGLLTGVTTDRAALVTVASRESRARSVRAEARVEGGGGRVCVSILHGKTDGHENSTWYAQEYWGAR